MLLHDDVVEEYRDFATYAAGDSPCFEEWALGCRRGPRGARLARHAAADQAPAQPRVRGRPLARRTRARAVRRPPPGAARSEEADVRATVHGPRHADQRGGPARHARPRSSASSTARSRSSRWARAPVCACSPTATTTPGRRPGACGGAEGPMLTAVATGPLPVPSAHPEVAWRGGVDLNPLEVVRPRRDGLAGEPRLARAGRAARAAARRRRGRPPRAARRCAAATSSTTCPRCSTRPRRTARRWCSTRRSSPTSRSRTVSGSTTDDRSGGGRALPVDQQRGTPRAAARHGRPRRSRRGAS